jgi:hypothetical protein
MFLGFCRLVTRAASRGTEMRSIHSCHLMCGINSVDKAENTLIEVEMEPNPGENLKASVTAILDRGTCSRPELIDLFRQTRLLIEHNGLRRNNSTAALYCDWLQHNEMDRNEHGFAVIERLSDASMEHGHGDYSGIFNAISDA